MREIVFKALTSLSNKQHDLYVQETFKRDGVLAKTERRCRYFIMGKARVDGIDNLTKLAQAKFADVPYKKRHYYVLKVHDDQSGEDRLLCKIAGMLYAVYGGDIYCIAFIHSFRIAFAPAAVNNENDDGDTL